ncbi:MAG TPA: YciI family protein [Pseudonocardiaceae bacterium]
MRFMLIIKSDAATEAGELPPPEVFEAMGAYNEQLVRSGVLLAGEGLHPSSAGARVRLSGGAPATVTPGPFPRAEDLVAGFWLIDARSVEEAVEWARRVPNPVGGELEIEVRRVFDAEDFGAAVGPGRGEAERRPRAGSATRA